MPLPALAFHNEQLQASAFREQYDPESFEDLTLPKYDMISKVSCYALFYVFFRTIHVGPDISSEPEN